VHPEESAAISAGREHRPPATPEYQITIEHGSIWIDLDRAGAR